MTAVAAPPVETAEDTRLPAPPEPPPPQAAAFETNRILVACMLATWAAAWMLGGIFEGLLARPILMAAGAAGTGWVAFAHRVRLSSAAQYLLAPLAFVAGVVAGTVLPNATGVKGTIPTLVVRAIRNGGLLEPPVPYDPGWRFLTVALLVFIGAACASITTGWGRAGLALLLPTPLVIAAGFVQPRGGEVVSGTVSLVLLVAALMVIYAARLASEGTASRNFEIRQAARGAAVLGLVVVALVALNRTNALFPDAELSRKLKPQKPQIVPLSEIRDRTLFTVRSEGPGPWRLGVLDEYDGEAWLLPPYDTSRLEDIPAGGRIAPGTGADVTAEFTIRELEGHTLPGLANPQSLDGRSGLAIDPRTQTFRARKGSAGAGFRYSVTGPPPPTGEQLAQSTGTPPEAFLRFAKAPSPPSEVRNLLTRAPPNPWERLQFLRNELYLKVVAAGSGVPVDVPPAKVDALLRGGEGTPFEITASEALLARWAGLPARIGYGFFRGKTTPGGYEVHPRDGANWLEAYFPGFGWVPVIGVPPKARASLSSDEKNRNVSLRPADALSLQVYIPVQLENPLLLYEIVRYWTGIALPFAIAAAALWIFFPAPMRLWRSVRRRRWAAGRGLAEQIAVEYAEFRDLAHDLNVGAAVDTPLRFTERVAHDDEHLEFAWLVTRALWGDLRRDLRAEDAAAAAELSRSVRRRLARGQSPLTRVIAVASRASLRGPYDPSLPNLWPRRRPVPPWRVLRRRRAAAATAAIALLLASCGGGAEPVRKVKLPSTVLPPAIGGFDVRVEDEASKAFGTAGKQALIADGKVLTLRRDGGVEAALQAAVFKPAFDADSDDVRRGVRAVIETGRYRWFKTKGIWVGEQRLREIGLYLWFTPDGEGYEILVTRPQLGIPKELLASIIAFQRDAWGKR